MRTYRLHVARLVLLVSLLCTSAIAADRKPNEELAFYRVRLSSPIDTNTFHVMQQKWQLDEDLVLHGLDVAHSVRGVVIEYALGHPQTVKWIDDASVYKLDVRVDEWGVSGVLVNLEFRVFSGGERAGGTSLSRFPVMARFEGILVVLPPLVISGVIEDIYAIAIRRNAGSGALGRHLNRAKRSPLKEEDIEGKR